MPKRSSLFTFTILCSLALCAPAIAGITVDQKCRSAKLKATGKGFAAAAKCYAKALSDGTDVSSQCLTDARTKMIDAFNKAGADCPGRGDAAADKLDASLSDVVGDVGCGDGRVEGDEECDDGNALSGDGCSVLCIAGTCGDGVVQPALGEECDDHGVAPGDGCAASCKTETGWSCSSEGQPCRPIPGDGLVIGTEECDDGNVNDSDGCSADGKKEQGWECADPGQLCAPIPGDGLVVGTEECDDGNLNDNDGCSSERVDTGWTCPTGSTGASVCTPICGDGMIVGGEECDDGSDMCGDGCDNHCKIEPPRI